MPEIRTIENALMRAWAIGRYGAGTKLAHVADGMRCNRCGGGPCAGHTVAIVAGDRQYIPDDTVARVQNMAADLVDGIDWSRVLLNSSKYARWRDANGYQTADELTDPTGFDVWAALMEPDTWTTVDAHMVRMRAAYPAQFAGLRQFRPPRTQAPVTVVELCAGSDNFPDEPVVLASHELPRGAHAVFEPASAGAAPIAVPFDMFASASGRIRWWRVTVNGLWAFSGECGIAPARRWTSGEPDMQVSALNVQAGDTVTVRSWVIG